MGLFGKKTNTVSYIVPDMNCDHCEAKVKERVGTLPNVTKVGASAKTKEVTLHYTGDEAPSVDVVNRTLEGSQYTAEPKA